jgi:multidrug resistance efflux pump
LRQSYLDFKRLQSDNHQNLQISNLQKQATDLQDISAYQLRQKQLIEQSAEHAKEIFHTDEQLYTEGVTSKLDLLKSKNKLLEKQNEQEDFNKTMLATSLKIKELEQNVNDISFSFLEKKRASLDNIAQSLANIENSLKNWQQDYLITAPADGKLVFLKHLSENQFLKATDTLFAVMPAQENYIATVDIPVRGMGKAEIGQKVIIKLDDYPYQEFGMLEGEVQSVFPSLNIRYYRVVVTLPKGLQSTYKHQFYCRSEMAGTAEIVTADMRILERAFYGFRKLLG